MDDSEKKLEKIKEKIKEDKSRISKWKQNYLGGVEIHDAVGGNINDAYELGVDYGIYEVGQEILKIIGD